MGVRGLLRHRTSGDCSHVAGRIQSGIAHRRRSPAWSELSGEDLLRELETGLREVLARELRLPESELESDRPFAELGLNSVMAMSIRREVEQLTGITLSATMLWNYPTIASLMTHLVKKLSLSEDSTGDVNELPPTSSRVLDALFDSVESAQ